MATMGYQLLCGLDSLLLASQAVDTLRWNFQDYVTTLDLVVDSERNLVKLVR